MRSPPSPYAVPLPGMRPAPAPGVLRVLGMERNNWAARVRICEKLKGKWVKRVKWVKWVKWIKWINNL